jgi:CRISPR-associated protein Cmr6
VASGLREVLGNVAHAPDTNAGLWHDVYVPALRSPEEQRGDGQDKTSSGEMLRAHLEKTAGGAVPDGYKRAFDEREKLLRALHGGVEGGRTRCFTAIALGRIVVGLGAQAVAETNLALVRAWGVPFIPGSALKGLASSAAHRRGGASWARAEVGAAGGVDATTLFGDTTSAGLVTFHDAWWAPEGAKLPIDLDVMTVHHADYYSGRGGAPADWDEPNPVSFLTTQGSYLVALSGPSEWVAAAQAWLEIGLRDDGIGAKTHAGYGRMKLVERLSDDELRARKLIDSLAVLPAQHKGAATARQHVERLRDALEKGAEHAGVAAVASALYAKEPSFWQKWVKAPERTEAEREVIARLQMVPAAPERVVVQPSATVVAPADEDLPWQSALAWVADVKKRATVFVRLGGRKIEREARHLKLDESLTAAMRHAEVSGGLAVEVQVTAADKLVAVRANA